MNDEDFAEKSAKLRGAAKNVPVSMLGKNLNRELDKAIVKTGGIPSVIEKLTAPPETVEQHLNRLKVPFRTEIRDDTTYIVIEMAALSNAERWETK